MYPGSRPRLPGRRGAVTLELILVLPILVVLLVATFELTIVLLLKPAVTHAATVGAREAGKAADVDELAEVVQAVIGVNCITVSDAPGSGVKIVLEDGAAETTEFGDPTMACPTPENPLNSDEVRVTVCVEYEVTPICDALSYFGFSLAGRSFLASSLVKKEQP